MKTLSGFDTWPRFYIWHRGHHNDYDGSDGPYFNRTRSIGPSRPDQLVCRGTILDTLNSDYRDQIGLIEMSLPEPIRVRPFDILGLQQQGRDSTSAQQSTVTVMQHAAVLIQSRGYGLTFDCYATQSRCYDPVPDGGTYYQQMQYIALEIGIAKHA